MDKSFCCKKFHSKLGGLGLGTLVLFLGSFVVVECHLCRYREGVDDATVAGQVSDMVGGNLSSGQLLEDQAPQNFLIKP